MNAVGGLGEPDGDQGIACQGGLGAGQQQAGGGELLTFLGRSLLDEGHASGKDGENEQRGKDSGAAPTTASIASDAGEQEVSGVVAELDAVCDHHPVLEITLMVPRDWPGAAPCR